MSLMTLRKAIVNNLIALALIFYIPFSFSNTIDYKLKPNNSAKKAFIIDSSLLYSINLQSKLDNFSSEDLEVINDEFQNSLNRPSIFQGEFNIGFSNNDYSFLYKRDLFTLLEIQNPIFPNLKITQFNDHTLVFKKRFNYEKFSNELSSQFIQRGFAQNIYDTNDLISDNIDFSLENGEKSTFARLSSKTSYILNSSLQLNFELNNLDIGDNPLFETYSLIGISDERNFLTNITSSSSVDYISYNFLNFKNQLSNDYFIFLLELNTLNDFNKSLGFKLFGINITYSQKTLRHYAFIEKSSKAEGINLSYNYSWYLHE